MKLFYQLLLNVVLSSITSMTVWFALTFYLYLQTQSVTVTGTISGIYLIATAITGIWFGGLVDHNRKKPLLLIVNVIATIFYLIGLFMYIGLDKTIFTIPTNPLLWLFVIVLLASVIVGNIRGIVLPTTVTLLVPEDRRDKANGIIGTIFGIVFLIVSVISGILVGHSGMLLVLILALIVSVLSIIHIAFLPMQENEIVHQDGATAGKVDLKGTIAILQKISGLLPLILFTTVNNLLGGVFMALMDAYGLSLVTVQVWGFIWGALSLAFIVGGLYISKFGLGKNPLKALFTANVIIWVVSSIFTVHSSIWLLSLGMFIYLSVVPFIEAAEHTIIQKVVPPERQGRVFGFAQSAEQAASPLTAFLIGPLTQAVFIPFMTTGSGVQLIGDWFGVGPNRGIALVFTLTGFVGLALTIFALRSKFYKQLSDQYLNHNMQIDTKVSAVDRIE